MTRAGALIVAVFLLLLQQGDGKPSVRASVCLNQQCTKTGSVGFALATVRATYIVPIRSENRIAQFGLVCTDYAQESRWPLDGDQERIPSWLVTYRDVPEGSCEAILVVWTADGSSRRAVSNRILIQ